MASEYEKYPLAPETYLPPIALGESEEAVLREMFGRMTLEEVGAIALVLHSIRKHVLKRADELKHDGEHGTVLSSRMEEAGYIGQSEGLREATDTVLDYLRQLAGLADVEIKE